MFRPRTLILFLCLGFSATTFSQVNPNRQSPLSESLHKKIVSFNHGSLRILEPDGARINGLQRIQGTLSSVLDTCATFTYRLKIGTTGTNEEVTEVTTLKSGEMLVSGKTNENGAQDDGLLIKLNASGTVEWMKAFG